MFRPNGQFTWLRIVLGLALMLAAVATSASGATLHAIIIGDIQDPNIGASVSQDLANISTLSEMIAANTGLNLSPYMLVRDQSTVSNLGKVINGLSVGSDDMILFYFSGHGDRRAGQKSSLPLLLLNTTILRKYNLSAEAQRAATIEFAEVVAALGAKTPRFLLALSDACDKNTGQFGAPNAFSSKKALPKQLLPESFKKLFLYQTGAMILASASPGEVSAAAQGGGKFTLQFLKALEKELASPSPSWGKIKAQAAKPISTTYSGTDKQVQTPQWIEMEITELASPEPPSSSAATAELSAEEFFKEFIDALQADDSARIHQLIVENPQTAADVEQQLAEMGQGSDKNAQTARQLAQILGQYRAQASSSASEENENNFPTISEPTPVPTRAPAQVRPPASSAVKGNLLRNGNFTQKTAGWNLNATNWAVYKGDDGIPFLATNDAAHKSQGPSVFQDVKGLPGGRTYTFDAEIFTVMPGTDITMAIWELGDGPNVNSTQRYDGNTYWQRFSVSHAKQRNNSTLRVEIYYEGVDADTRIRDARLQ